MKKKLVFFALGVSLFVLGGFVDNEFKITKNLDIFFNLYKEVNYFYVDDIDPEKIMQSGIDGMLKSLDPYTTFIPESKMNDFKFQTTGQYGGIGAIIRRSKDGVLISEPYEGCPAAKTGLLAGDVIIEIDGKNVKDNTVSDVSELLKGEPGTNVTVLIKRPFSDELIKKTIRREKITIPNVPYFGMLKDSVGYIKLTNFTTDAGEEVRKAVKQLKAQRAKAYILDLRDNPGGLLNEAVKVANCFMPKKQLVVYTKGRIKEATKEHFTIDEPEDTISPVIVLVNRGSASASEIVTGALQDLDRAVIVGQRTFGKGLVQQTRPLSYNTQLKVTTAKYYIPSGRCIQAVDYSHRNEDGSVGHIPDSLIKEFKTRNGRKVYDGGGIIPDIKVIKEKVSDITYNLYLGNYIFDFATQYCAKNKKIETPEKFTVTDTLYDQFITFLKDKDFDYKTKSEEELKKLIDIAKKEKYYQHAEQEFAMLKEKLSHNKEKDLQTFRNEISGFIIDEIVTRKYFQKGRIIASLQNDIELDSAMMVIKNKKRYYSLLQPSTAIVAEKPKTDKDNEEEKDEEADE
ncbi:MAG TPA: S41 family peptidase [Bacteroidales bacterium]|nr:S41 family peptidase [Bacteroidales bacterium]